jgi:hypothetical protein
MAGVQPLLKAKLSPSFSNFAAKISNLGMYLIKQQGYNIKN